MEVLLIKLSPLILLLGIGIALQTVKQMTQEVMNGIKYIILYVSLPAVLFSAFIKAPLKPDYLFLFLIVFVFCCLLYGIGKIIARFHNFRYCAEYFTGFEFGMVGIALFTSLWGQEKLPIVVLIGLGHEIFIWFVYMPLLEYKNTGQIDLTGSLRKFISHPIIIAIIAGIGINLSGYSYFLESTLFGKVLSATLLALKSITGPLILLIVGYSLKLSSVQWKETITFVALRFIIVLFIGTVAYYTITRFVGQIDPMFASIFFAFILLPPPFILPLFIEDNAMELRFFSNAIIVYTLLSFVAFVAIMMT